ncbi:IS4 family transposase [Mesorhizobium sp. M0586]|uniref:IS4 family transposase n=1 Tax=unclassified Mesorhizobium TaxID=325217 RepID=UPI0033362AF8
MLGLMVDRQSVCVRRLAGGCRGRIVGFGRFLANGRVTTQGLIEGWGSTSSQACAGHVLAIQDTSEIHFTTTAEHRRGLGETGKGGNVRGALLHAMLALAAGTGEVLGLVSGQIWTRDGRVETPHGQRLLTDKESQRWLATAEAAKGVLVRAAKVTEVSDRESDIYAKWDRVPGPNFHILTRAMSDRLIEGGKLSTAKLQPTGEADVELRARPGRPARTAHLAARFGQVALKRPQNCIEKGLAKTVTVSLVEVLEVGAPADAEPIVWRLLTTHTVQDAAMAWQVVAWYRMRWTIEQFFRTLKQQGLQLEDSQLETAERLMKLTAIAARAACIIMQLVQARDGPSAQSAEIAFTPAEIDTLQALVPELEGKTALQKNPHPPKSLAWAAWIIAKLGGWDGYPKSKPPGPITFRHDLQYF